jgi:predicted LPLAT superfamily acyltransferase
MRHHCGTRADAFMQRVALCCLPLAYLIGWFATWWFWLRDRNARRASADYLRRVTPDPRRGGLLPQTFRHMYQYALTIIDCSAMLAGYGKQFAVTFPGREALIKAAEAPGGLLLLTAHVGAIEITAPRFSELLGGRRAHFVMYQDLSDEAERYRAENWRSLQTFNIINSMDAISASIQTARALMAGEAVGMRADRRISSRFISAEVLGSDAKLPDGPFTAAVATGANVVLVFAFRTGYRRYELHASEPRSYRVEDGGDKQAMAAMAASDFAAALTESVRRFPLQWFNFYPFWDASSTAENSNTT